MTLALDESLPVAAVGTELEQRGFLLNLRRRHMVARKWIQVSLLGDPPRTGLENLLLALRTLLPAAARLPVPASPILTVPGDLMLTAGGGFQ